MLTLKAIRMGTLAALCIGVADEDKAATTRQPGFVGRYRSVLGISIYRIDRSQAFDRPSVHNLSLQHGMCSSGLEVSISLS